MRWAMPVAPHRIDLKIMAATAIATVVLGYAAGFALPGSSHVWACVMALCLWAAAGVFTARGNMPIMAAFLAVAGWLGIFALVTAHFAYVTTAANLPLHDAMFARFDEFLGFDFKAILVMTGSSEHFASLCVWAYAKTIVHTKLAILFLALKVDIERLNNTLSIVLIGLISTLVIAALLPANDAFDYYGLHDSDTAHLKGTGIGRLHLEHYFALRDGSMRDFPVQQWKGLVTFPSFHVISAVATAYALWTTRWLRWPAALLSTFICFTVMPIGGHYFADVAGGLAIGAASIWYVEARSRRTRSAPTAPIENLRPADVPAGLTA